MINCCPDYVESKMNAAERERWFREHDSILLGIYACELMSVD